MQTTEQTVKPTISFYTVTYAQTDVIAEVALEPQVFTSYEQAVNAIWEFIEGRIIHACPTAFVEEFYEYMTDWLVEQGKTDVEPSEEHIRDYIKDFSVDEKVRAIDWEFEFEEDSMTISTYTLTKHELEIPAAS
ncbi:hypothetical protein AB4455_12175 [Vibrio sp. 10N.261.46.E12]|uniref:hypothetical protein n=1 Tax=unclassified Vibrio TaxID=2614977 RepID=UPI0009789F7B|nr:MULTISPECIES: hypothetical protein [unclassified Vibrio]OMO34193.1 hypothetical protein BH584_13320 [Vibrio sp. 10N.261.45.E1]PMJ33158.1 hypothetical protein BCU27_25280 [Vibrio sp. 10N.286.45.B6]PML86352.1 hypothetical protein BCT66_14270 [Vibrio sp. 10N.261.49.E11]PMM77468.1 hypothetical protein BCT48_23710 [Vibrio sp. 10N.261.46.F12]PMM90631.1 hypothetical protein BCT46_03410 [Vibrio sp. 10N.261.46.E8]